MKVLSIWAPWAQLIVLGFKDVENRGWSTEYRGPLAIHATKGGCTTLDAARILEQLVEDGLITAEQADDIRERIDDDRGKVIGVVEVTGCVKAADSQSPWAMPDEKGEGYAIVMAGARRVEPIVVRGSQGMRDLDDEIAGKLAEPGEQGKAPARARYELTWAELVGDPQPRGETNDDAKAAARADIEARVGMVKLEDLDAAVLQTYRYRPHGELPLEERWAVRATAIGSSSQIYDSARIGDQGLFDEQAEAVAHGELWMEAQRHAHARARWLHDERCNVLPDRLDQVEAAQTVMVEHVKKVRELIKECADDSRTLRKEAKAPEMVITAKRGRFVVEPGPALTDGTIGRRWWGAPGDVPLASQGRSR